MAEIIDRMELSQHQRVELYEEGVTWIVQAAVPGVKAAQASEVTKEVTVEFDPVQVSEQKIRAALSLVGYPPA